MPRTILDPRIGLTAPLLASLGCTLSEPKPPKLLYCNDDANTVLCWNELTCLGTPAKYCAAHLTGDPADAYLFPNAEFVGDCSATNPEYPLPKCACEYTPGPPKDYCVHPEHADPEGGEGAEMDDPTTGGPSGPTERICTIHAQTKCVETNYVVDPFPMNSRDCGVHPDLSDDQQPCVIAEDEAGAKAACKLECDKVLPNVLKNIAAYNMVNEPDLAVVGPPIDCIFDDAPFGDEPTPRMAPYECAPPYNALPALGSLTDLRSVRVTTAPASLYGGSSGVIGSLGFGVSGRAGDTCEVVIDAFETVRGDSPASSPTRTGPRHPTCSRTSTSTSYRRHMGRCTGARGRSCSQESPSWVWRARTDTPAMARRSGAGRRRRCSPGRPGRGHRTGT